MTEQVFVEKLGGVDGCLLEHCGKFNPTSASIDHGEKVDIHLEDFIGNFILDSNCPWSCAVKVDNFPRFFIA